MFKCSRIFAFNLRDWLLSLCLYGPSSDNNPNINHWTSRIWMFCFTDLWYFNVFFLLYFWLFFCSRKRRTGKKLNLNFTTSFLLAFYSKFAFVGQISCKKAQSATQLTCRTCCKKKVFWDPYNVRFFGMTCVPFSSCTVNKDKHTCTQKSANKEARSRTHSLRTCAAHTLMHPHHI